MIHPGDVQRALVALAELIEQRRWQAEIEQLKRMMENFQK